MVDDVRLHVTRIHGLSLVILFYMYFKNIHKRTSMPWSLTDIFAWPYTSLAAHISDGHTNIIILRWLQKGLWIVH